MLKGVTFRAVESILSVNLHKSMLVFQYPFWGCRYQPIVTLLRPLVSEKLKLLKEQYAVETDVARKFQLNHQIEETRNDLKRLKEW